jgi:membrane protease YdiL (CAAX protease family)
MKLSRSQKTYILLVLLLAVFSSINVFLPQGALIGEYELPASKPVTALAAFLIIGIIYGGLGILGLHLSNKLGFSNIWSDRVTNNQRFIQPAIIGMGIGIFFIICDFIFSKFNTVGHIHHLPFPASLTTSIIAGIGEEIVFRLFFISFWLWLISSLILKGKGKSPIFWIITTFSAIVFAIGHLPSVMSSFGFTSIIQIPSMLLIEVILLNGVLSFFAAYYFRKYGFLAAVGIHFWTDLVWHVIFGLIIY